MAHHRKHHHHHHRHHRHNPFGISTGVVKDAAFVAGGAIGSTYLAKFAGQSGWLDVGATALAAVITSYAGKFIGGASASEELLKGGLTATILKALSQAGFATPGLGVYASSYFPVPTSSDAYGRASAPMMVLPPSAKGVAGLGYQRYRSRYQTRF